ASSRGPSRDHAAEKISGWVPAQGRDDTEFLDAWGRWSFSIWQGELAPFERSSHGLLASNRCTGEICPDGQLESPHPDLPLNASGRSLSLKGRGRAGGRGEGRTGRARGEKGL